MELVKIKSIKVIKIEKKNFYKYKSWNLLEIIEFLFEVHYIIVLMAFLNL
jgi:hypothetical protein